MAELKRAELEQAAEVYKNAVATRVGAGNRCVRARCEVKASDAYFNECCEAESRAISRLRLAALGGVVPEGGF